MSALYDEATGPPSPHHGAERLEMIDPPELEAVLIRLSAVKEERADRRPRR